MRKLISFKQAAQFSLYIFTLVILFHGVIIVGILLFDFVPIDYLWGGRMETRDQLLGFEFISLLIMAVCLLVVLVRSERIKIPALAGVAKVVTWILFFLFLLNTVGNALATTTFEKFFAVVTALLAFLCLRLALGDKA